MIDLSQRIRAELENIDEIFSELPQSENLEKAYTTFRNDIAVFI